ncbi:MAG TPA: hypothetical protein VER33_02035 [Polyangiaceae bacterium]|nr:hypothetical protein [Polyangiaceae bacterium]
MGIFDRLFGTEEKPARQARGPSAQGASPDKLALDRYRYMIKTAPPETIEQAHAEAFSRLTPEQRRQVLAGLAEAVPPGERAAAQATSSEDPQALARLATRAEVRQPGLMERTLGGAGGMGMGMGASLLSSFAMGFVGSMVAQSFFSAMGGFGDDASGADDASGDESAANDEGGADDTSLASDEGGFGGDDFGGGDFDV